MAVYTEVTKKLVRDTPKLVLPQSRKTIKSAFMKKKSQMIADFLNHPVTQEIKGGISATNISGTLGGVTNLFSFIGFEQGDDPIQPIIEMLQSTTIDLGRTQGQKIIFSVKMPEPNDIFAVTPLPYVNGRSWAKSIETGLSGLGFYLKKSSDVSRSGLGIQAKKKVRNARFQNTKYISAFLKYYKKEFEKLKV